MDPRAGEGGQEGKAPARCEADGSQRAADGPRDSLGAQVLERLREQPGGPELLELARGREDMELVGGAVRDLLLGRRPRELDVVVAADAPALAETLGERLGAGVTVHERFGTAYVEHGATRLDFATRRGESYPAPGALPEVREGTPMDDLLRRDFSVNAIAVTLDGPSPGELRAVPHALDDLREGRLRVLHEASFEDDPTRLLRLARYHARLGFAVEEHTAQLARRALAGGALNTVSGARVGAELRLALRESRGAGALDAMQRLGVLAAVHPRLRFELPLVERAMELLPREGEEEALPAGGGDREGPAGGGEREGPAGGGEREALLLATLVLALTLRADGEPGAEARAMLDRLEFPQGERDRALNAAMAVPRLLDELPRCVRPSELYALTSGVPLEAVALAGALGATEAARRWLQEVRRVRLQIDGGDLLARGVPQGPEVGWRLRETLLRRLDGELGEGREAELAAALELPWPS